MLVMLIAPDLDIFKGESINLLNLWVKLNFRELKGLSLDLDASLVCVVEVKVAIATCPNKFARREVTYLGHHASQ